LKDFSTYYANAVTAAVALLALLLTAGTLYYLRREYRAKYRPAVMPLVVVETVVRDPEQMTYVASIQARNVGIHPCKIKLTSVQLSIGDEIHPTPDAGAWSLCGVQGIGHSFPAGYIAQLGIDNIRQGRYRKNWVEVRFNLHSKSIDDGYETSQLCVFEIEMRGDAPVVLYIPNPDR
jgi:hypothetical protein